MIKRGFIAVIFAALLAGCGGQSDTDVADENTAQTSDPIIKELMRDTVEVQAQIFWASAGWIMDEEGEHDLTPTTDEGWQKTQDAAATVGKMGALLMSPEYSEGRGDDWTQFSEALVEISKRAEQAAIDRDSDAVFETGGTMYRVCKSCHQSYMPDDPPPSEDTPEDGDGTDAEDMEANE